MFKTRGSPNKANFAKLETETCCSAQAQRKFQIQIEDQNGDQNINFDLFLCLSDIVKLSVTEARKGKINSE